MFIDTQFLSVKSVPANYSWDQGIPSQNTLVNCVCAEGQLIGYAPLCNILLKSEIRDPNIFAIAFHRKANFGDFYNSERSIQTTTLSSEHIFCHNYIMPGEYTLSLDQTQYITLNNESRFNCLQKYCLEWNWENRQCEIDGLKNTTWANTLSGGEFEKKWAYEKCEDESFGAYGVYIERGQSTENRFPFSWQWYNFFNEDYDRRTEFYASYEPRVEELPETGLPRTWDDAVFQGSYPVTWDEAVGPCLETRVNDVSWRWRFVSTRSNDALKQEVTWKDTKPTELIPRLWRQVRGAGCLEVVPLLSAQTITERKELYIKILEIPPTAYLEVLEHLSPAGTSPYTVKLTPRHIVGGSFPIEKIVWNFGDGSPLLEQSRYNLNKEFPFVYSDQFGFDIDDPRNFDVVHTYYRTSLNQSCFYPSLTAYASSTNSSDCAAAIVGPLTFEKDSNYSFHMLQNKLTDKGIAYLGEYEGSVLMWTQKLSN